MLQDQSLTPYGYFPVHPQGVTTKSLARRTILTKKLPRQQPAVLAKGLPSGLSYQLPLDESIYMFNSVSSNKFIMWQNISQRFYGIALQLKIETNLNKARNCKYLCFEEAWGNALLYSP